MNKYNTIKFKHKSNAQKLAFTLAEVLITLGIIGVVAALTLIVLIAKYKETVKLQQLKKVYTTFMQIDEQARAEYGEYLICPNESCNPASNNVFLETLILPYIQPAKVCLKNNDCPYTRIDAENGQKVDMSSEPGFILQDGTLVKIVNVHGSGSGWFAMWLIDINGAKGPNETNKDIYFAEFGMRTDRTDGLTGKSLDGKSSVFYMPINAAGTNYGGVGSGCFKEIIRNGWKAPKRPKCL